MCDPAKAKLQTSKLFTLYAVSECGIIMITGNLYQLPKMIKYAIFHLVQR